MATKNSQTPKFEIKNFKDVYDFCYLNGVTDINTFVEKCFKKGFDIEKYGLLGEEDKIVEKIVEVVKEVPAKPIEVEVIKYVDREIVKEVPVEKIVEKIVNIYDKTKENELLLKIQQLEDESKKISTITQETTKIFQNEEVNNKNLMLQETLIKLRKELTEKNKKIQELENKIKELEKITINQGAVFMKGSNIKENL